MSDKPIKWMDQFWHFISCFLLTALTCGYGAPIAVLWAVTREYYQTKIVMHEVYRLQYPDLKWKEISKQLHFKKVFEKVRLFKLDLNVSYFGTGCGILVGVKYVIPFYAWLF